jgi:protein O-mannosyl-transferase
LIGVWGIAGVVRLAVFVRVEPPSPTPLVPYLTAQVPGIWRYVGMLVAPLSQSLVHPAEPMRVITAATWLGALGLAVGISTVIVGRRREPVAALGIGWFLLLLLPSSLVPLPEVMAEHRIYAASSGIFLAMGAAWGRLDGSLAHRSRRWRAAAAGGLGLVLATLCVLTVARNAIWANPVVLWQDAAQKAPRSWRAHFGMANALAEAGNCHDAIPEFDQALRLEAHAPIFMNLATCLAAERRMEEAARAYKAAFAVKPGYVPAHFNLALLALGAGDRGVAQRHFLQAVTTDTRDGDWQEFLLRTHMATIDDPALTLEMCRKVHDVAPETPSVRECLRNEGRR